jgi:hypothetical protein
MQNPTNNVTPATAGPIDRSALLPARTITPRDTAALLNRSVETLERWRRLRIGPPFYRLCGRVLYNAADVTAWIEEQKQATGFAGGVA